MEMRYYSPLTDIYSEMYYVGMDKYIKDLRLGVNELELLDELLCASVRRLKSELHEVENGDGSISECCDFEFESEIDAEYYLELMEGVGCKLGVLQSELNRNQVTYIEQTTMFRMEQIVYVYQVSGRVIDQLVYVFRCRHGSHYVYLSLEPLIASFSKGHESEHHFGCEKEVEHFLRYWQG
ncbi:MAG: hypothetical protein ACSHX6_15985 [Akkermansiaceae bacterium]